MEAKVYEEGVMNLLQSSLSKSFLIWFQRGSCVKQFLSEEGMKKGGVFESELQEGVMSSVRRGWMTIQTLSTSKAMNKDQSGSLV